MVLRAAAKKIGRVRRDQIERMQADEVGNVAVSGFGFAVGFRPFEDAPIGADGDRRQLGGGGGDACGQLPFPAEVCGGAGDGFEERADDGHVIGRTGGDAEFFAAGGIDITVFRRGGWHDAQLAIRAFGQDIEHEFARPLEHGIERFEFIWIAIELPGVEKLRRQPCAAQGIEHGVEELRMRIRGAGRDPAEGVGGEKGHPAVRAVEAPRAGFAAFGQLQKPAC